MKIEINGIQYTNPDWRVENGIARLAINTEKSFSELAEDFGLSAGDIINQYNENDDLVDMHFTEHKLNLSEICEQLKIK